MTGRIEPSPFLVRHLSDLPRGRVLDLACGEGRHALFLARHGYCVEALDRDVAALRMLVVQARVERLPIAVVAADLEMFPLPRERYEVVLNFRYLQRSLAPAIAAVLRPRGVLVFETFTLEQARCGKPKNPDFLLRPGELRRMFPGLETLDYFEGLRDQREAIASLLARKPGTAGPW